MGFTRRTSHPVRRAWLACVLLAAAPGVVTAQPRLSLRVPPYESAFENFSTIALPKSGYTSVEIVLKQAVGELQRSTIRVTLNEMPMTPFVSVNPMPRGVRAIVKLNASLSPDYSLHADGENVLGFTATDEGGVGYRAQFYLLIDPTKTAPELARNPRPASTASAVRPPPQSIPPAILIQSAWPSRTADLTLQLQFEVSDAEGLRRIVLEVNGKDVEEVALQNERPVRKKNGMVARGALPGTVTGDGHRVVVTVPVRLDRGRINVVAVRAENVLGLSSRADRTVETLR